MEALSEFNASVIMQGIRQFQDMPYMPIDLEEAYSFCDQEASCAIWEDGSIKGLLMLQKKNKNKVELLFARSLNGRPDQIADMLLFAFQQLEKKYDSNTKIRINCNMESSAKLIAHFLPEAQPLLVRRGVLAIFDEEVDE